MSNSIGFEGSDVVKFQGLRNSNNCSCTSKSCKIAISIIFGIGGVILAGVGLQKYLIGKTLNSIKLIVVGCGSLAIPVIVGIFELIKWPQLGGAGADARDTGVDSHRSRITGASLINSVRSDPKTISGACKILGVSEDQIHDKKLIESQQEKILQNHTKRLNQLLEIYNKKPSGSDQTQSPIIQPQPEPAPLQALRLMMDDVYEAYQFLMSLNSSNLR